MSFVERVKDVFRYVRTGEPPRSRSRHEVRAYDNIYTMSYTGEKNLGEIGPVIDYKPDYPILRLRSWQSFLESEITQTVIKKFTTWVIGSGLKLQAEPLKTVLKSERITLNPEEFNEVAEARFSVFANSTSSDYSGMRNLHFNAKEGFINAIVGGDVLVILRYIDEQVKIQLVDGAHVCSPMMGNNFFNEAKERGNVIRHGVELSKTGEHVAYYVKNDVYKYERISAKNEGLTVAFLVYGMKYRLDSVRGIPLIGTVLETIKKLERYKEATVGSAEERQKIAYFIEHGVGSTGENPLAKNLSKAFDVSGENNEIPIDIQGKQMADKIAATTNKQAFNLPIDSTIKAPDSKMELHFKDFYGVNIDLVCAALSIPPNVALSKYDSNFSASRAALKDWEHTINVNRAELVFQFYSKVYRFWLHTEILKNKISAPGYLGAIAEGNWMVIEAYVNARFIGSSVPHIDPVKEVTAERLKLGVTGAAIPLTTVEKATEALNGGGSDENMMQYAEELKEAKRLGLEAPVVSEGNKPPSKKEEDETED